MQGARFAGNGRIEIGPAELPPPAAGEVRVRVAACCLCGSDLRPYMQGWPLTPGHEIAGIVETRGHSLSGSRVLVYIPVHCGDCPECRAGATNVCRNSVDLVGWQRPGGFAEALNVPMRSLLPVPDDIPLDLAPLLLDTIGTAAHGIRLAKRVVAAGSALVLGAGPVGLGAVLALQRLGFGPVNVIEPQAPRRRMAEEFGARPVDVAETQRYPLVVEASGRDPARQFALDRVAPLGAVVQLGEAERWSVEETKSIRRKDFYYIRSFYFPIGEYEENLPLFRADRAKYARLVDRRAGLAELGDLFAGFARGERLKPALVFDVAEPR
jgi:L-iditol 2-dehydrogenase